jgi:DNA-binding Lrp family transcriptional regulator
MKNEMSIKILQQLLKNSKKSDRELAKAIGVSQATFTRRRRQLEKKIIQEYTITPNLYELGFEILAFTFIRIREPKEDFLEKARVTVAKLHNVIFASGGEGLGMESIAISVHKDYTSYLNFISEARQEWKGIVLDVQSFLVSLKGDFEAKPFSLKPLAEILPTVVEKKL